MTSVLIPLAPGFEDLEAVTLVDLLRRAGIEVVIAGLQRGLIQGSRGTRIEPDAYLDDVLARDFDLIALPGGLPGAEHLRDDARVQALLKKMAAAGRYTAAICAAPMALAKAGLLDGKHATAYPGVLEALDLANTESRADAVVVDGKVVTSQGPGTAMEFALTLIELLVGAAMRKQVEAGLVRL
ncbi:MAG: DJ-1 family protein [Hydrogenophilales bacterium 28-61-23]|nr:MAG: DJ-1 family protein [Hydrogenophilales bacterium 28-61-23]